MLCKALKTDTDEHCTAYARAGSDFCFYHDPAVSPEEKREVQSRGGQGNKRIGVTGQEPLPSVSLANIGDVLHLLEITTNELRSGKIDSKLANGLGYLAGHAMKAIEMGQLEKRIEALEVSIQSK